MRKGGGPRAGSAAVGGAESSPEALTGSARRCGRNSGHEDPVAGAMRSGAAVARGPGWLRRGRPLLSWPGPSLLRPWLEAGQGLWNVLLRSSLPSHRGLLLRLRQGVPSSPLLCGRMESLEQLRRSVPAHHACAQAFGASGATEWRGALPTPGRESRLPGVLLITGPGLRALLCSCLHN